MYIKELFRQPNFSDLRDLPFVNTVIFDMDGTLLDTEENHAHALLMTLNEIRPEHNFSITQLKNDFLGLSDLDVFKKLNIESVTFSYFLERKNNHYTRTLLENNTSLTESMRIFFKDLKDEKYKLALVTASERQVAIATLEQVDILNEFDEILCRDDLEKSKPHPLPYLKMMERLSSTKERTLIFEDSETGLASAKASGANYIKASWFSIS